MRHISVPLLTQDMRLPVQGAKLGLVSLACVLQIDLRTLGGTPVPTSGFEITPFKSGQLVRQKTPRSQLAL